MVLYLCRPRENSCALAQFIESMGWMRACFIPFYADARELCKIQSPVAMYLLTKLSANREETYLRICKPVELQRQIESSYCVRLDNRVEDIITDSFSRFDCNYLDFRQFYVNWPKEITWCFPGDFEIIDSRQRLCRSNLVLQLWIKNIIDGLYI